MNAPPAPSQDPASGAPPPVADARPGNWVDRYAPAPLRPWLRLMRADRPIGIWLLLWPCWWSQLLAERALLAEGIMGTGTPWPNLTFLALFAAGAVVMRGAGCTYNDIVDRDFDAKVTRTRSRPLPSGQVSLKGAYMFMAALMLAGLAVLLQFNPFTIGLGMASLGIVALYPFMKRLTFWPQAVLGAAFGWGALMGWSAVTGGLALAPLALFFGTVAWIIGYDTIYAHQDKEDDALLGLKSTALKFGTQTKAWLVLFYGAALSLFAFAGLLSGTGLVFFLGLGAAALHFAWQIITLDIEDAGNCLARFKSNRDLGAIIFAALMADRFWQ